MRLCVLLFAFLIFPVTAFAQPTMPSVTEGMAGEIISEPICTDLINRSDQLIMGTILTAPQTLESGDSVRHRRNFKLEAGTKEQICAAGPFYEGRRIELVIRTLIPLFTCRTTLTQEIYLDATPGEGGMKKLSATCH